MRPAWPTLLRTNSTGPPCLVPTVPWEGPRGAAGALGVFTPALNPFAGRGAGLDTLSGVSGDGSVDAETFLMFWLVLGAS